VAERAAAALPKALGCVRMTGRALKQGASAPGLCQVWRAKGEVMKYVDGFVLPVPKKNVKAYAKIARLAGKVWRSHGALDYCECMGDDLNTGWAVPFPKLVKPKAGETIFFSFIVYKSRKHRDEVNAKAMRDPRLAKMMDPKKMPFDCKRMCFGGFKVLVRA
jgi:uncharacterized protein YbaA (DUF1428 family)